eukprot:sb/3478662/
MEYLLPREDFLLTRALQPCPICQQPWHTSRQLYLNTYHIEHAQFSYSPAGYRAEVLARYSRIATAHMSSSFGYILKGWGSSTYHLMKMKMNFNIYNRVI